MNTVGEKPVESTGAASTRINIPTAFLARVDCPCIGKIFDEPRRARIASHASLNPVTLTPENFAKHRDEAARTEVLFTTWGLPHELLTPENFPALRLILYSAGSVKFFARPLMERGVQVVGARVANATAVAHFCLAQIILGCKGYFQNTRMCRDAESRRSAKNSAGSGLYGEKVALLGMGAVARDLCSLLKPFDLKVLAVDPYLSPAVARELGVELVTMEEAFATAYIVSNHLPNLPELKGVLNRPLFFSMRPHSTFINTGRGAQVNEADLVEMARKRPDFTALLDVTDPEPPVSDSPLYGLPNIQLTSHIAGAINDEVRRLGDFVIGEFERYAAGQTLRYAERLDMLDRLA